MKEHLSDFTPQEFIEYLGLDVKEGEDIETDGILLTLKKTNDILEKIRHLKYGDIRGHISVSKFANISYSESNYGNSKFLYDYYEKVIRLRDTVINIESAEDIKLFISSSMWVDFSFYTDNARITMVLVP